MQFSRGREGESFMEKKKLLLVAVSVGVFLVIVIGAAIVMLSKQDVTPSIIARESYAPGMSGTIMPNTSSIGAPAGIAPAAAAAETATNLEVMNQPANPANITQPASVDAVSMLQNPEINVLKAPPKENAPESINYYFGDTTSNASDITIERYTPEGARRTAGSSRTAPVSAPVSTPKPADIPPPSPQLTRAPASAPAPKPAPAKVYNDYWVQTGSFRAKVRADNVKESLGVKGISSVIEVRNVNDQTWYRVRVGPYTSQNEAEYWLSLIQSIDGFEQSQIWQSQSVH